MTMTPAMTPEAATRLDHLVVIAPDLDSGVRWCEATLGLPPGPGGAHPLMGTHNRLLKIATPDFPNAYLEIIAIDTLTSPQRAEGQRRWFDLDEPALQARVARDGPQLAHWVARTADVRDACAAWAAIGIDRGPPLAASRMTTDGLLAWQITVRDDGQRLFDGALPTLIQWGAVHPAPRLAPSPVTLHSLRLCHPDGARLCQALDALGLPQPGRLQVETGPARIEAQLDTPRGTVTLGGLL